MLPFLKIVGVSIPMYGLCIVVGVAIGFCLWIQYAKKNCLIYENGIIIAFCGIGIGVVGAKITYILVTFSFSEIKYLFELNGFRVISDGGFVFYGGLIFGLIGAIIAQRFLRVSFLDYERGIVPLIPLVHCFGRIGCLFAGCCYGKNATTPFYIEFSMPLSDAPVNTPLVPVQIYEALFCFGLFVLLRIIAKKTNLCTLPIYLCLYAVGRFIMEFLRDDKIRGSLFGMSTSQFISVVVFVSGVLFWGISKIKKQQTP